MDSLSDKVGHLSYGWKHILKDKEQSYRWWVVFQKMLRSCCMTRVELLHFEDLLNEDKAAVCFHGMGTYSKSQGGVIPLVGGLSENVALVLYD